MPSRPPKSDRGTLLALGRLGEEIRKARRRQKVSSVAAAEAAGVSRATLYRIERGHPSVTIGAYANVIDALGLKLRVADRDVSRKRADLESRVAGGIPLDDYPQLKALAWSIPGARELTPEEAFGLYKRNWRFVDVTALSPRERKLIDELAETVGNGRRLVEAARSA